MQLISTRLPEVWIVEPRVHADDRGYFVETWHTDRYAQAGIAAGGAQDNLSFSNRGVLRGLHYQHPRPQAKLVQVLAGAIFDVAVDIRRDSPSFGQWVGVELTSDNHHQLFIPAGFAHGFCVLSETALVAYKCDDVYVAPNDACIRFDEPRFNIAWPVSNPLLSPKDAGAPRLADLPTDRLPSLGAIGRPHFLPKTAAPLANKLPG